MTGLELLAGAAVGYLVRKARRVGRRADAEVDRALDAGMDALHEAISRALPDDPALVRLQQQAQAGDGEVPERTVRRATDAIADVAEEDREFAERLRELVEALQRQEQAAGAGGVNASGGATAAGRDVVQHAETGGVIAGNITGGVKTGNPPRPGPEGA